MIEPEKWPQKVVKRNGLYWKLRYSHAHVSRDFIYNNGVYERHSYDLLNRFLKKGMTFIDVGANCGYYTILAGRLVGGSGKVISYEPSLKFFEALQINVKNNSLQNVTATNKGLSDNFDELDLISDGSNASVVPGWIKQQNIETDLSDSLRVHRTITNDEVKMTTLDYESNNKFTNVDFIKIDIEGFENQFYGGAKNTIKKHRPIILIEYTTGVTDKIILPELNKLNYSFIPENFNFNKINYNKLKSAKWVENPSGHILEGIHFCNILCVPN